MSHTSFDESHIQRVGLFYMIIGAILITVVTVIGAIGLMAWINEGSFELAAAGVGVIFIVPGLLFGGLHIATGMAFRRGRDWARPVLWVLSILQLGNVPLGTALGIYAIWVLIKSKEAMVG